MLPPFLSEDFWNHGAAGSKKAQNKSSKRFNVVASGDLAHETNSKRMVLGILRQQHRIGQEEILLEFMRAFQDDCRDDNLEEER